MQIDKSHLPAHIAIIMDGNGRWARQRGLPKIAGHKAGIKSLEETIKAAKEIGIGILTFYTFSTENWKRPKHEVNALMRLLEQYLDNESERLIREDIRIKAIGKISNLPPKIQLRLRYLEEKTLNNKSILVNFALNYGGRAEIVDAVRRICEDIMQGIAHVEDISEEFFSNHLYTSGIPDPDLLIRTSGEMRMSNFLLWQLSYTEIYITKKLWPDFGKKDFLRAIAEYQKRERRYGG